RPGVATISDYTQQVGGITIGVHAGLAPLLAAVLLGVAVAAIATWAPASRARRADVAAELSARGMRLESAPRVGIRRLATYVVVALAGLAAGWAGQRHGALHAWQPVAAE